MGSEGREVGSRRRVQGRVEVGVITHRHSRAILSHTTGEHYIECMQEVANGEH